MGQDGKHRFAPRTLDPPDGHPTQAQTHRMGVTRQAPASLTGGLMLQLEAEAQQEGADALEERLAIAQQVEGGGVVSKIDRDGAVVSCRCGYGTPVSPSIIRARTLMGHDGENAWQSQEL